MSNLTSKSKTWQQIREKLEGRGEIGAKLDLVCPVHHTLTSVSQGLEFRQMSPEGGCSLMCDTVLICKHKCQSVSNRFDFASAVSQSSYVLWFTHPGSVSRFVMWQIESTRCINVLSVAPKYAWIIINVLLAASWTVHLARSRCSKPYRANMNSKLNATSTQLLSAVWSR